MNPEIMLFDEPTSALDPEMIKEVLEVMQDLAARGHDHDRGYPRNGLRPQSRHRVVFLESGKIVEEADSKHSSQTRKVNGQKSSCPKFSIPDQEPPCRKGIL